MSDMPDSDKPADSAADKGEKQLKPYGALLYPALFLVAQFVAILIYLPLNPDFQKGQDPMGIQLLALLAMSFNMVWLFILARKEPHKGYLAISFQKPGSIGLSVAWIFGGTLLTFYAFVIQSLIATELLGLEAPVDTNPLRQLGEDGGTLLLYFLMILNVAILAPIVEEIVFRGLVLQRLFASTSTKTGIFVSGLLFAAIHFDPKVFFPLFVMGVLAGMSVVTTRSILPAIGMHFLNNAIAISITIATASSAP